MKKTSLKKCLLTTVAVGSFMLSSCDVKVTNSSSEQPSSSLTTSSSSPSSKESSTPSVDTALQNVIALLNALSDTSTEAEITAARSAYNALTDAQKASVPATALAKLVAQEKRIKDTKDAAAVVEAIKGLSETPTKEEYLVVLNKYNSLSDEAKALVTNKAKLDAAGAYVKRMEDVDAVIAAINALSDTPTEAEYNAVLEKYNALPEADRSLVTNYSKLTAAKDYLDNMKKVNNVITMIDNLSATPSETDVTAARTAYDALPETYKSKVTNYSKLQTAEEYVKDYKAASAVIEMINALGSEPAEADVTAAENAYTALDAEAKAMVTNYQTLTEAKTYVETIKKINAVIAEINALTNESEQTAVTKARTDYDALPDWAKAKVTNYSKLQNIEDYLKLKEQVAAFETYVNNIVLADVTADTITEATGKYDALGFDGKAMVSETAKAKYDEILIQLDVQAANAFAAIVDAIDATTVKYAKVVEIRTSYNALSAKAKELFDANTAEKAKYDNIIAHIDNDAKALDAELAKLPTEIEDEYLYFAKNNASIKALRETYNSLADEIKGSVTAENLAKLTNIEAVFEAFNELLNKNDAGGSYISTTNPGEDGTAVYTYAKTVTESTDNTYGAMFDVTLAIGTSGITIIPFSKTVSAEALSEYKEVYFYFYNPQDTAVTFTLGKQGGWGVKSTETFVANKGWNKIVAKTNKFNSEVLGSFTYPTWASSGASTEEGWKISPIYGYKGNAEEDATNIAKVKNLIAELPTSLSESTDYVKTQSISKLAYAETFYKELSPSGKTSFDATDEGKNYATLKTAYDAVGTVVYGMKDTDSISCVTDGVNVQLSFDTESDFAKNFGTAMKITIPESIDVQNGVKFLLNGLSGDYSAYSKFVFSTYCTLKYWNENAVHMANGNDAWITNNYQSIPGYHSGSSDNDYGYGLGIGLVSSYSEVFDTCKNALSNCTLSYKETWGESEKMTLAGGYLAISPIVALK